MYIKLLLICCCSIFCTTIKADTFSDFLKANAIRVQKQQILNKVRLYLDSRFRKDDIYWFEGTIFSKEGEQFDGLQLKFNTMSNSLYLKHGELYYSLSSAGIEAFSLKNSSSSYHFIKGFGVQHQHAISGQFSISQLQLMNILSQYPNATQITIQQFSSSSPESEKGNFNIQFLATGTSEVYNLQRYLVEQEGLSSIQIKSKKPLFDEGTFFELLVDSDSTQLLKLHAKQVSKSESVTLADHSATMYFERNTYYISNADQTIQEIRLTKKSLRKGLGICQDPSS